MRPNKISQNYSAYQVSFQKRNICGNVPKTIANAIINATNLKEIEKKYALKFERNTNEDVPGFHRTILLLWIKKKKPYEGPFSFLNFFHTPTENKLYKTNIVAQNDNDMCKRIQDISVETIEETIQNEEKEMAVLRLWGVG